MTIFDILKDSAYRTEQFSRASIDRLNGRIVVKTDKKGKPYATVDCLVRKKPIVLKPEEVVRQLYIDKLLNEYGYPASRMQLEYPVYFGRDIKRADIVIMDEERPLVPYIIIEVKKPKLKEGKEQLKSYCNSTGAPIAVWCNGEQIAYYYRKDPNYFEDIRNIPSAIQTLSDIISERWTIEDLKINDVLRKDKISLKDKIKDLEDEVLSNAGVDVFEECFKLIFAKLYDEFLGERTPTRYLEFTTAGHTEYELKDIIQNLLDHAKDKWQGVFEESTKINLSPSHLSICVASLQSAKLFKSNLEVIDDAFEYLMSTSRKGKKGQFFTPRYVIEMCVRMLNPQKNEKMIDTACGSSGFPVHTIYYVWKKMAENEGKLLDDIIGELNKEPDYTDYVQNNIFGIDFDEKVVRVARTLNLIAGDGHTNVLHLNTLDYDRWQETIDQEDWRHKYYAGFDRLLRLRRDKKSYREFKFDIVMANPPFAGDIKETRILGKYELSKNSKGKMQNIVGRDILFIERNIDFLKPGGRMAIVLPQGRFNNSGDKYIRDYIADRCRILAIVGLHGNTFKPHTGTKTSVLFVQKWDDTLCPRKDDYNIFFATQQKPAKDNSGDPIYVIREDGTFAFDEHDYKTVEQDLYNHDKITGDGIAEAFAEFAKKEGLSFFQ